MTAHVGPPEKRCEIPYWSYGDIRTNVTGTDCNKTIGQEMCTKGRRRCALQQIFWTSTGAIEGGRKEVKMG